MLGFIAYRYLFKPLRNAVNPLYTAKLVEETVPDAKNSLVNWVDLQDRADPRLGARRRQRQGRQATRRGRRQQGSRIAEPDLFAAPPSPRSSCSWPCSSSSSSRPSSARWSAARSIRSRPAPSPRVLRSPCCSPPAATSPSPPASRSPSASPSSAASRMSDAPDRAPCLIAAQSGRAGLRGGPARAARQPRMVRPRAAQPHSERFLVPRRRRRRRNRRVQSHRAARDRFSQTLRSITNTRPT